MRNMAPGGNTLIHQGLRELQRRLPPGWTVTEAVPEPAMGLVDAVAEIRAPDRRTGTLALQVRARLEPKSVRALVQTSRDARPSRTLVVFSRYLSERTRDLLREIDVGYLDLTGNAWIVVPKPGLFIETQGATEDPDREERSARSLRGPKAGRIVRVLIDHKQPPGVRQIAALTRIDAGYVSRVLAFLDTEALITRVGHGRMQSVDWPALLRRWAQEAPLELRGVTRTYLDPRGSTALVTRLAKSTERYAITGGLAAAAFSPTAPARLATIWVRGTEEAAKRLGLRPAEAGANVLLIEPGDESVFEGAAQRDGVWYAAPSQVAVDLLTSPGRGPAEGEELINWMRTNEEDWRR